jgi:hypothetical protein
LQIVAQAIEQRHVRFGVDDLGSTVNVDGYSRHKVSFGKEMEGDFL